MKGTWCLAIVLESRDEKSLCINNDDWFRTHTMNSVQGRKLLWSGIVKGAFYLDVPKVDLFRIADCQ